MVSFPKSILKTRLQTPDCEETVFLRGPLVLNGTQQDVFQVNLARTGNELKLQCDFHSHRLQLPLGAGYL